MRWRSFNTELWPRRYTDALCAVAGIGTATFQAWMLSHWGGPVSLADWCMPATLMGFGAFSARAAIAEFYGRWNQRRHHARRVRGFCGHCGYDLRGTESLQCPECGTRHGASPMNRHGGPAGDH
jgi:hypothetical protein